MFVYNSGSTGMGEHRVSPHPSAVHLQPLRTRTSGCTHLPLDRRGWTDERIDNWTLLGLHTTWIIYHLTMRSHWSC